MIGHHPIKVIANSVFAVVAIVEDSEFFPRGFLYLLPVSYSRRTIEQRLQFLNIMCEKILRALPGWDAGDDLVHNIHFL